MFPSGKRIIKGNVLFAGPCRFNHLFIPAQICDNANFLCREVSTNHNISIRRNKHLSNFCIMRRDVLQIHSCYRTGSLSCTSVTFFSLQVRLSLKLVNSKFYKPTGTLVWFIVCATHQLVVTPYSYLLHFAVLARY